MDVAAVAERTALGRLLCQADLPGTEVRGGEGWVAIRTGLGSNDLNGVVSQGAEGVSAADVADLVAWFDGVPASWLTSRADPLLTELLVAAGARPERAGHWVGRDLVVAEPSLPGVVLPLGDPSDHLDVAQACGWFGPDERAARREQLLPHPLLVHRVVRRDGEPVAMATGFVGTALEVVAVAVRPEHRRQGLARALVEDLVAVGHDRGLGQVVAAPTPDGARLFAAMGFTSAPVTPDVCFYLPT